MEEFTLIAKTFAGLEEVLSDEIKTIGGRDIKQVRRAVTYKGNKKTLYKSNYMLRSALRILKQISVFQFRSVDDFYKKCRFIAWENIMNEENSFAIFSTVSNSKEFRNSMFASLRVKDAIVDHFRQKKGIRPNVDTIKPDIIINVHISENRCTISIDSSGESLHKRGYRVSQSDAPLNEVLAAGMILLSGWKGNTDFIDPMCGSGTLPIEAVLIATNTPPGVFRKEYAFENWSDFDNDLFESIADEPEAVKFQKSIYASDISPRNIGMAKANARNARVFKDIKFEISDFKDLKIPANGSTIMINPPYGERLESKNLESLYEMIGERLKHKYPGNEAWIISSSKKYFNKIGLKPNTKIELYNAALKCSFQKYELFSGKRNILQ